jgi:hypothetical protein
MSRQQADAKLNKDSIANSFAGKWWDDGDTKLLRSVSFAIMPGRSESSSISPAVPLLERSLYVLNVPWHSSMFTLLDRREHLQVL